MAKLLPLAFALLTLVGFVVKCRATTYIVGDTSGWDISTNVDSWAKDKRFVVGDVLLFQYSSTHSVSEVDRESYKGCNMTNVLQSSSNWNTSFALTNPGNRYFVCGNRLHCYGGMKLHVLVQEPQAAAAAAPTGAADAPQVAAAPTGADAPQVESGGDALPTRPTSKSNNIPNSAMFVYVGLDSLFLILLGFLGVFCMVV